MARDLPESRCPSRTKTFGYTAALTALTPEIEKKEMKQR